MKTKSEGKGRFRPANSPNVIIGMVILAGSLFFVFYMVPSHIHEPPFLDSPMMSPKWLPNLIGWLTVVFSALLIIEGLFSKHVDIESRQLEKVGSDKGPALRWGSMVVALAIYFLFFEVLGSVVSGIMATTILFLAHPIKKIWIYLLAIVFPLMVTFIFTRFLNVPMPTLFL